MNQLTRYARSEKRKAYHPATKGITSSGYPDTVFYSKTTDGTLIIEGVIYHFSKPAISQRKADISIMKVDRTSEIFFFKKKWTRSLIERKETGDHMFLEEIVDNWQVM